MKQVICLMGPTASGKTDLACQIYDKIPCEIISVDSVLVYRGMNIGTAKPDAETLARYPHHLIDILDPAKAYSAAAFCEDATQLIRKSHVAGKTPLLVGGTMLYFKALQQGLAPLPEANLDIRSKLEQQAAEIGWPAMHDHLTQIDPATAQRLKPNDKQRIQRALEVFEITGTPMSQLQVKLAHVPPEFSFVNIALDVERPVLHQRIERRFDAMLDSGFVEEVYGLKAREDLSTDLPSMRSVGYRQLWAHLDGEYDYDTMRDKGMAATRQLAKRQMTWLRRWPDLHWVQGGDVDKCLESIFRAF